MKALLICPAERENVTALAEAAPLSNLPVFGKSLTEHWLTHLVMRGATEVWLRLQFTQETMTIVIEDNGRGFEIDGKVSPDADGLANLNRRLTEIGGRCEYRSQRGKGTSTTLTAPFKNRTH